jgi:hypothetical protein
MAVDIICDNHAHHFLHPPSKHGYSSSKGIHKGRVAEFRESCRRVCRWERLLGESKQAEGTLSLPKRTCEQKIDSHQGLWAPAKHHWLPHFKIHRNRDDNEKSTKRQDHNPPPLSPAWTD